MKPEIEVENIFLKIDDGVTLTDYGVESVKLLLDKFSGKQIKQIGDVSRSALINYVKGANRISKRGEQAVFDLVARFNRDVGESDSVDTFEQYSDREMLDELTKRGYQFFIKYEPFK